MKRFAFMMTLLMVLSLSTVVNAAAYQPNQEVTQEFDDILVEGISTRVGTTIPKNVWDLSGGKCNGQFIYANNVYGNYLYKTNSGKITVTVNSWVKELGSDTSVNTQQLVLYKKASFGYEKVSSRTIRYQGAAMCTFSGLENNQAIYFLAFSKVPDGTTLSGTFVVQK